MKTTTKQKMKKILLSGAIALTLVFSNFFGLTSGLISMFAFADYTAENYKTYDFETSSSWSVSTSFQSSTDNKPFDGTSSRFDLITSDAEDKMRPDTKYDGVSTVLASGATRDKNSGDYAMIIKANNAPSTQNQVVKENNKIVYDKENFQTFATAADAEDEGKYKSLEIAANKFLRLYDPSTIASADRSKYMELTSDEKDALDGTEYDSYLKLCLEKTQDVDIYYGYKSSSITLNANAYYVASFWAYTAKNDTKGYDSSAQFVIKGTNYEIVQNIDTDGEWKYYTIFLAGKSDSSTSVNIYFYYGNSDNILAAEDPTGNSSGFVVLDDIVIKTINQTDYNQQTIDGKAMTVQSLNNFLIDSLNIYKENEDSTETPYYTLAKNYVESSYSPRIEVAGAVINNSLNASFTDANFSTLYKQEAEDSAYLADTLNKWSAYVPKYTADDSTTLLQNETFKQYKDAYSADTLKVSNVKESEEFATTKDTVTTPGPNTFNTSNLVKDNYILKLVNDSDVLSLGYSTNAIKINQLGYYRVSVWLKATDEKASATVKMHSDIGIGTGPSQVLKSQAINPYQTTSDATNNWMEVVFYVRGNTMHDYYAYLTILADSDSTIYVDNIKVEKISSSTYTSGSSSKRLDLALSSSMPTTGISNGYFTSIKTTDDNETQKAPYEADNWTLGSDNTESIVSGIIPTTSNWDNSKIGSVANPNTSAAKTNVYAIYAKDADSLFNMKSSSFSLTSSTVYKIFFSVYADANVDETKAKLIAKLTLGTDEDTVLAITNTSITEGSWTTYAIYVRIDDTSRSLKLNLTFEGLQGTVFVKDIRHITIADIKEDDNKTVKISKDKQYEDALAAAKANTYFLDFMSEQFATVGDELTVNGLHESFNYKLEELDEEDQTKQGKVGIIFINTDADADADSYTSEANGTIDLTIPKGNISNKLMIIENAEADMVSNVNPLVTHSLAKSSFYKLTFKVKTSDFEDGKGLTIKINSLAIAVSNLDTNEESESNTEDGYRTYTVYVRTGSESITSTYVGFELTGKGYALVSDINLTKFADKAAYEEAIEGVDENAYTFIKDYFVEVEEEEKETPAIEDNNGTLAIFFYVLSSLLLVGAIVVALVAFYAKKHPIKKRVHGTNNADLVSYNKDGKPVSKRKAKNDADKGGFV